MNRISTFLVMGCITVFLISLFACGGGGGGDGGGFVPVSYTGSTDLATIDGSNASYFADLAGAGTTFGMVAPNPYLQNIINAQPAVPIKVLQTINALALRMPDYLIKTQGSQADLAAAVPITDPPYLCLIDGQITTSGTWDVDTGTLSGTQTFTNCDEGDLAVFDGQVNFVMTGIAVGESDEPDIANTTSFTMSQTYLNLNIYFQDLVDTVTIYAEMDFTFDISNVNGVIHMDMNKLIIALQTLPITAQIRNYSVTVTEFLRETSDPDDDYDQIEIPDTVPRAEIYDNVFGFVYVYTQTPVLENITGPYSGIMIMEGQESTSSVDFSIPCTDGVFTGYSGTYTNTTETGPFCYIP